MNIAETFSIQMEPIFKHITESVHDDILVIKISGETLNDFDLSHAIADEIDTAIDRSQTKKIVVDLRNVEFITSVGLVIFARLLQKVRETGLRVELCNASEMIADVLQATHLDSFAAANPRHRPSLSKSLDGAIAKLEG